MDDKFQPYQTADDKIVITFGLYICVNFMSCSGAFNNAFVFSLKFWFLIKIALFSWYVIGYNLHINKNKIIDITINKFL